MLPPRIPIVSQLGEDWLVVLGTQLYRCPSEERAYKLAALLSTPPSTRRRKEKPAAPAEVQTMAAAQLVFLLMLLQTLFGVQEMSMRSARKPRRRAARRGRSSVPMVRVVPVDAYGYRLAGSTFR